VSESARMVAVVSWESSRLDCRSARTTRIKIGRLTVPSEPQNERPKHLRDIVVVAIDEAMIRERSVK